MRRLITPVALFVFELLVEGDDGEGAAVDFEGIFFHWILDSGFWILVSGCAR